jgi:NADPH:quinone reductase
MGSAVRIDEFGGPEVLHLVDIEVPTPGEGEVVLEIHAIGVNPVDSKIREGKRSSGPLEAPIGLGSDASGVLVALGSGVTGCSVGDAVIGAGLTGAYATDVATSVDRIIAKPAGLSFEAAASLGVPVGTAYQVLTSIGLAAGETLLVHAGSGGVGQAAIQFGVRAGATVIATAGESNQARLAELGAIPVVYGDGLLERVRAVAPQGVDLVLDAAGTQEAIDVSLALVADPARIGEIVNVDWADKYGVSVYSASRPGFIGPTERALRAEGIALGARLAAEGTFELEIAETYPLSRVVDAARHSDSGHVRGKIVLLP